MRTLVKVIKIISTAALILILLSLAVVYVPGFLGYHTYSVISGSMEPEIPVGSAVYVHKTDKEDIKPGDVITFIISDNTFVTHRIVSYDEDTSHYTTKGDANEENDIKPVVYENIAGVVKWHIPMLGYLAAFLESIYIKIAVIALLIFIEIISELCGDYLKERTEKIVEV